MSRPVLNPALLQNGMEAWDAFLRDFLAALATAPLPVVEYADFASLPAAGSFDRCLAATVSPAKLWFSQGGVWKEVSLVP
ncbi:MAG: hypothetical protein RJA36_1567 [Pseudomonadota bacterium]|jgi:hypothetical protein